MGGILDNLSNRNIILIVAVILAAVLIYYIWFSNNLYQYMLRTFYSIKEPFQDTTAVAGGSITPTRVYSKLPKITCDALTTQIAQYLEVKEKNPDIVIRNLDETVKMLKEEFNNGKCNE